MKYTLGWTMTQYYETTVDADSEEEARAVFVEGGIGNLRLLGCWAAGDTRNAKLQYCNEVKDNF